MSYKLQNYLRTYRKRSGLSQDEVAFLLGCRGGTKVSRYERSARKPNLEILFAYEVMFGAAARELFAGVYQKVEKQISNRAQLLTRKPAEQRLLQWRLESLKFYKRLLPGQELGLTKIHEPRFHKRHTRARD